MKKVASYVKNLGNSMKFATIDVIKESNPNIAELINTNSELFKEISYVVRNRKTMMPRVSRLMKNSKIYEFGEEYSKALFEDIASGTLYNPERKEKFQIRAIGNEDLMSGEDFIIDDSDMDLSDDFGSFDDFNISDGDEFIADSVESSTKASAEMISMSVARSSQYIVQSQRTLYEHSMMHNTMMFGNMNSALSAINQNISHVINFNEKVNRIHIENTTKYYEESIKLFTENNAILKEMVEMERNRYKVESTKATSSAVTYDDIVNAAGIPDLKKYFKNVQRNIDNELSSVTGMMNMFEGGNTLLEFAGSPLEFIPKTLVRGLINDKFKSSLDKLDKSIGGFFSALTTKFNTWAKDDDDATWLETIIGKAFRVRNDLGLNLDRSKYNRGAMAWDGDAKRALTEVIPGYLARLVSLQSGQKETTFDYDTGKYVYLEDLKKNYENMISSSVKSATSDARYAMEDMLKLYAFKDRETKESLTKDMAKFFEYLFKEGVLFNPNKQEQSPLGMDISNENNFEIIKAMYKNLPRQLQMSMYTDIMSGRDSLNKTLRNYEEKGSSYMLLNSGFHETYNTARNVESNAIVNAINNLATTIPVQQSQNATSQSTPIIDVNNPLSPSSDTFSRYERERASKNNLRYIEDLIADNTDIPLHFRMRTEIENRDILNRAQSERDKNKKNNGLNEFVEDLLGSSLRDKFRVVSGKLKTVTQSPWNAITGVVDRIDLRLYEIIYGKDETEYRGENVKGLLDMMMVDLRRTFDTFNTWMDEKILTPLSEKINDFGGNALDRIFGAFGLDITTKDIKGNIAKFIFGEKDEETGTRKNGVLSKLMNQVKTDLHMIKTKVFGPNSGLMKIIRIINEYGYDPTKNTIDDQLAVLIEIEDIINNSFKAKTEQEISLKNTIKAYIDNFNADNPAETILSIGMAIDASGLNTYSKSVAGILKSQAGKAKDYVFGESKNTADKIQSQIYSRYMDGYSRVSDNRIKEADKVVDSSKLSGLVNIIIDFDSKGDYSDSSKRALLGNIVRSVNNISITTKAETSLISTVIGYASNSLNINNSLIGIINEISKHSPASFKIILNNIKNKLRDITPASNNIISPVIPTASFGNTATNFISNRLLNTSTPNITHNPFKDGQEDGSHSTGLANVPHDGYKAILHQDERVLTKDDNDNLVKLLVEDIAKIKAKVLATDPNLNNIKGLIDSDTPKTEIDGKFKQRVVDIMDKFTGNNIDEIYDQLLEESNKNVEARGSHTRESLLSKVIGEFRSMVTSTKRALYGGDGEPENIEKDKDKFLEAAMKDFKSNFKDYLPKMGSGALIGGGIGLIPGLIGGPMMWGAVGAATALVNNSEGLKDYLFGPEIDGKRDGGKLLSKKALEAIDKYSPDMKKYGITGAALSLTPLLPGGPIAGLMMGSAYAFAKNNAGVQEFLFGEDGLVGPKAKEKLSKLLPKSIAGTIATGIGGAMLTGSAFGPFGLLGGAVIGTSIGLVSSTDKFQEAIFGKPDEDGVNQGGLVPAIRDVTVKPLKEFAGTVKDSIKNFAEENIKKPFSSALDPFKKEIKLISKSFRETIQKSLDKVFENTFGAPFKDLIQDHIVKPFKNFFHKIFSTIGKVIGAVISTPFKALAYAGNELRIKHMKGGDADYMSPEEQDEMIRKHPIKFLFGSKTFSRALANLLGVNPVYAESEGSSENTESSEETVDDQLNNVVTQTQQERPNKKSFIQKMNDKIMGSYNNMKDKYNTTKSNVSSKLQDGKNKFLNRIELAARAGMSRESETSSSSQSDDEPESQRITDTSNDNSIDKLNNLLKDRDDKIKSLEEKINKLAEKQNPKYKNGSSESDDNSDTGYGKDLNVIKNHVIVISNEVQGQLDGVGYNIETIKNILLDNFGQPSEDATGIATGRGNKSRRGFLGQIFDFLKNPTQKLKGFMKGIMFGSDGEGGLFGWVNKGFRVAKEILLAPFKAIKEVVGFIKGIGTMLVESVKMVGPAIAEAVKGAVHLISAPFIAVGKIVVGFGEGLGKAATHITEAIGFAAGALIKFTTIIPNIITLLGDFALSLTDTIWTMTKGVGKFIGGVAKFGVSALFKDKMAIENNMTVKIDGGYLDSIKNIEVVKIIEKVNSMPDISNTSTQQDGMYTRFGKITFRRDHKGAIVPVRDSIYMQNEAEERSDNEVMAEIRDLTRENSGSDTESNQSTGFMGKMKNKMFGFLEGMSSLTPLLFLALPFLPQIGTAMRLLLENFGIGTKAVVETGAKVTSTAAKWAWDKSHQVLDSPERNIFNFAKAKLPGVVANATTRAAATTARNATIRTGWNTVKQTRLGAQAARVVDPAAKALSKVSPKNVLRGIIEKMDDIFRSSKFRKLVGDSIADSLDTFAIKLFNAVDDGIILTIGKKIANWIPVIDVALFITDFTSGLAEAENILQVDGSVPFNVRVMAGLIKALNNKFLFGLIPNKKILQTLINLLPMMDKERDIISSGQKALLEKYNTYKQENPGTKVTFTDFNNSENWKLSAMTKFNKDPGKKYEKKEKAPSLASYATSDKAKAIYTQRGLPRAQYGRGLSDLFRKPEEETESKSSLPFYSQKDPKWNKSSYNIAGESARQNIGNSGCGPTSAAMVISGLTGEPVTPSMAAQFALNNKYKEYNGGTLPEFFESFGSKYGLDTSVNSIADSSDSADIINKLKQNIPVILMGKTDTLSSKTPFGKNPHYVVATGLDSKNNILIHNPEDRVGNKKFNLSDTLKNSQLSITSEVKNPMNRKNNIMGEDGSEPVFNFWDKWKDITSNVFNSVSSAIFGSSGSNNEFIRKIIPGAMKSFRQYGILPSITIAQAILESGYGKKSIDNNIFGIKATPSWKGATKTVMTTEYRGGIAYKEKHTFRAYNSVDESILDHGKLIGTAPRYSKVRAARDYKVAANEIYRAGYATDPKYPSKLINIIENHKLYLLDNGNPNAIDSYIGSNKFGTTSELPTNISFNKDFRGSKGNLAGNVNMHEWFVDRFRKISEDYGNKSIHITSGYRQKSDQQRLWDERKRKYPYETDAQRRRWVADPNSGSLHQHGIAADVAKGWIRNLSPNKLAEYGLWRPMSHEPWHFEPIETGYPNISTRNYHSNSLKSGVFGLPGNPKYSPSPYIKKNSNSMVKGNTILSGLGTSDIKIPSFGMGSSGDSISFKPESLNPNRYSGGYENNQTSTVKLISERTSDNRNIPITNNQIDNKIVMILIKLLTNIVNNTNNLTSIVAILSEGLNINIPESKLSELKASDKKSVVLPSITNIISEGLNNNSSSNSDAINLINMLNAIAAQ